VTPDREPGDTVLGRDADTGTDLARAAREAALAAGPVPAPRPEVLERVLHGLRDLPAARRAPRDDATGTGADPAMPLPRRRT
jgi:hypothetical protein